ncbi:MAG TPA: cardiolipin synthase [Steroidobacteraceae bacterium]|nr:cardiolipin synthase [Steroidobacteraceae bacterium]
MDIHQLIVDVWPGLASALHLSAASWVTIDAILRKRQSAAVIAWVGLAWLAPFLGALAYWSFGINRVQRKGVALDLRSAWEGTRLPGPPAVKATDVECIAGSAALAGLVQLGGRLSGHDLVPGNQVEPLVNGDATFPAMLDAIEAAERSITLVTYIFDNDRAGDAFFHALVRACTRGVEVRVLIDDFGAKYTRPSMVRRLARAGIVVRTFLPTRKPWVFRHANLRNHRKIVVVDGRIGFVGGTNIREDHWFSLEPRERVSCLHFRIEGPVVAHLQEAFAIDWAFTTGERLKGAAWFPEVSVIGKVAARGISDGPDEDLDKMPDLLLGALSAATRQVTIVTPYFLPDDVLLRALQVTAKRGVEVDLVIPRRTNFRVMDWAMRPQLRFLVEAGCRVHLSPPPFDHSKLFVVDDCWALIGSTNWDARSLRLNFEYNVECYDPELARRLRSLVVQRVARSRQVTVEKVRKRPVPLRLRDGLARLFAPYL